MYKIYHTASLSLEPVSKAFTSYDITKVNASIQKAEDAAATGSLDGHVLVTNIIDLHDKHMDYFRGLFPETLSLPQCEERRF